MISRALFFLNLSRLLGLIKMISFVIRADGKSGLSDCYLSVGRTTALFVDVFFNQKPGGLLEDPLTLGYPCRNQ